MCSRRKYTSPGSRAGGRVCAQNVFESGGFGGGGRPGHVPCNHIPVFRKFISTLQVDSVPRSPTKSSPHGSDSAPCRGRSSTRRTPMTTLPPRGRISSKRRRSSSRGASTGHPKRHRSSSNGPRKTTSPRKTPSTPSSPATAKTVRTGSSAPLGSTPGGTNAGPFSGRDSARSPRATATLASGRPRFPS